MGQIERQSVFGQFSLVREGERMTFSYESMANGSLIVRTLEGRPQLVDSHTLAGPAEDMRLLDSIKCALQAERVDINRYPKIMLLDNEAELWIGGKFPKLWDCVQNYEPGEASPSPCYFPFQKQHYPGKPASGRAFLFARWFPNRKFLMVQGVRPFQLPAAAQRPQERGIYVYFEVIRDPAQTPDSSRLSLEGLSFSSAIFRPRIAVAGVGDNHGCQPRPLMRDLMEIGVVKVSGLFSKRYFVSPDYPGVVVQIGDAVDVGAHSNQVYKLWRSLQESSPSQVIRLVGNHELAQLIGNLGYASRFQPDAWLQQQILKDVLSGKITAAWSEGDTLYTHAGLDLRYFPEYRGRDLQSIVEHLNRRLVAFAKQVRADDPESNLWLSQFDAIFDTTHGIFWARHVEENNQFRQVVGHTPHEDGIICTPGSRVKFIDAMRVDPETGEDRNVPHAREIMQNTVFGMKVDGKDC